ncbi:hypothetical protein BHE74_00004981 [Ensete ventricosum]|nr:hypothetical protein BHE74_00004981 [Ensete ventricosum]
MRHVSRGNCGVRRPSLRSLPDKLKPINRHPLSRAGSSSLAVIMAEKHFKYVILGGGVAAGYAAREFAKHGLNPGELAIISKEAVLLSILTSGLATDEEKNLEMLGMVNNNGDLEEKVIFYGIMETRLSVLTRSASDPSSASWNLGRIKVVVRWWLLMNDQHLARDTSSLRVINLSDFGTPGANANNIFYLREIDDADKLVAAIEAKKNGKVVIVGGGYIGLELSAVMKMNNLDVTMVYPEPWCMPRLFTSDIAAFYEARAKARVSVFIADLGKGASPALGSVAPGGRKDAKSLVYPSHFRFSRVSLGSQNIKLRFVKMGDAEGALPASKKRVAGRQLSKDDPDPDEDAPEAEMGTFKKASEEVMATRRIVKVRRNQPPTTAASNPFAGIRLVTPVDSSAETTNAVDQPETGGCTKPVGEQNDTNENSLMTDAGKGSEISDSINKIEETEESSKKLDEKPELSSAPGDDKVKNDEIEEEPQPVDTTSKDAKGGVKTDSGGTDETNGVDLKETEKEAKETTEEAGDKTENEEKESEKEVEENDKKDPAEPDAPLNSFQQLSSSQNAFSGLAGTGFSTSSFSFGSIAKEGSKFGTSFASPFAFKSESSSLFSFGTGSTNNGDSSLPSSLGGTPDASKSVKLSEVPVETGEENERAVFTADAIMYEYLDGGWKERGKGELRINISASDVEKARLVMRAKGNYRLILNANLYPDMSLTNMDKRGITFACINSTGEGKDGLTTVAIKFKDSSIVQEFRESVMAHKGQKAPISEPEESSKESDV